jgi:hypothetical protein
MKNISAAQFGIELDSHHTANDFEVDDTFITNHAEVRQVDYTIRNCNFKNGFIIAHNSVNRIKFIFYNCTISTLTIEKQLLEFQILIAENCTIDRFELAFSRDDFRINFKVNHIFIKNEEKTQNAHLEIASDHQIKSLTIDNTSLAEVALSGEIDLITISSTSISVLDLSGCINKTIELKYSTFSTVKAIGLESDEMTIGSSCAVSAVKLDEIQLGKLSISAGNVIQTFQVGLESKSNSINEFIINKSTSVSYSPAFFFKSIEFKQLDLEGYTSLPNFTLQQAKIENIFNLNGVDLTSPKFSVVDLRRCVVKMLQTNFLGQQFRYVEWPTHNRFYEFDDGDKSDPLEFAFKLKTLKETYRQLKIHFISENDMFDAMIFQTNELRTQHRIKSIETWRMGFSSWRNNVGDWFLLWSNSLFSNFGLSWIRPLLWWLFVFHLVLFNLMLLNYNLGVVPSYRFWIWDIEAFWEGLDIYLKLLFPIHDSDIKKPFTDPPFFVDIWGKLDFSIRIVSSYFIFLIIRGTRKFNFKIGT